MNNVEASVGVSRSLSRAALCCERKESVGITVTEPTPSESSDGKSTLDLPMWSA